MLQVYSSSIRIKSSYGVHTFMKPIITLMNFVRTSKFTDKQKIKCVYMLSKCISELIVDIDGPLKTEIFGFQQNYFRSFELAEGR